MHLKKLFCLRSILGNDDIVSALRPGLKKGVDLRGQFCRVWKMTFLVWDRVRIWITGRHTPTKNSQEYPPGSHISSYKTLALSIKLHVFV